MSGTATFGSGAGSVEISGANNYGLIKTGSDFFDLNHTDTIVLPISSGIFAIYIGDGQGALFFSEYQSATVTKLAGSTVFAAGSSSGDIRVYKGSTNTANVTVENQRSSGGKAVLKIMILGV